MADYAAKIAQAKKAGYSDAQIAAYLSKDAALGPKIAQARQAGYNDAQVIAHLSGGSSAARARKDAKKFVASTPDAIRALTQGPTFSFADEVNALGAAATTGVNNLLKPITGGAGYSAREAYDAVKAEEKAQNAAFAQRHPVMAVALPIVGGLAAPGSAATGRYVAGANSLAGTVRRSAAVGVGLGALAGAGAGDGVQGRTMGAVAGGLTGGAVGAAVPVAARVAGGVVRRLNPQGEERAMQEAMAALDEAGIDVRSVSTATMDRIRAQVHMGRNAREAALGVVANEELPVPLPMTRGQRTGDPGQQLTENLMLRGARGSAASRQMRGLVSEQQQALRGNVNALSSSMAGGATVERGMGGELVANALNDARDSAWRDVGQAYNAARAAAPDARLPPNESFALASQMREAVAEAATERSAPAVFDEINAIAMDRGASMQSLQAARTRLAALQTSADGAVRTAAGKAKAALDEYIQGGVERGFIEGDAASAWTKAIAARRDFGRTYESGGLVEKLTARGPDGRVVIEPSSAANEILSRSNMGFVGKRNLARELMDVRDMVGQNSPEWNAMRAEVFNRIAATGESGVESGERMFSGVKFLKAWDDFKAKDRQLVELLFTPEERAQIDRFATLAARVTNPVKGGDNPSNTATTALRLLGNLKWLRALPFVREITTELEMQVNLGAARAATSSQYGRAAAQAYTPGPAAARMGNALSQGAGGLFF